jgi:photosystem II stability/assembly factor-like uncharacterized protein
MERTGQRLIVISAAVAVIVVAGVWYARPVWPTATPTAAESRFTVLSGSFSTTYDFLTPMLGWSLVVDYSAYRTRAWIFKTVDGGMYWERDYLVRALGDRTFLHFFDPLHGFAFTGFSYRTVDGGAHWEYIDVPGTRPYVTFASPTEGWAEAFDSRGPHLYGTVDGGKHWTLRGSAPAGAAVLLPVSETQASPFRDSCQGWLGAGKPDQPIVFLTTDCGQSWRTVPVVGLGGPLRAGGTYVTSVRLVSDGAVAVFVGDDRAQTLSAALSSDAGATWQPVFLPASLTTSNEISLLDSTNWWMFRPGSIYRTNDAGASWQEVQPSGMPKDWSLESARAVDGTHAWAVLVSGVSSEKHSLAMTADGGSHWQLVTMPLP